MWRQVWQKEIPVSVGAATAREWKYLNKRNKLLQKLRRLHRERTGNKTVEVTILYFDPQQDGAMPMRRGAVNRWTIEEQVCEEAPEAEE